VLPPQVAKTILAKTIAAMNLVSDRNFHYAYLDAARGVGNALDQFDSTYRRAYPASRAPSLQTLWYVFLQEVVPRRLRSTRQWVSTVVNRVQRAWQYTIPVDGASPSAVARVNEIIRIGNLYITRMRNVQFPTTDLPYAPPWGRWHRIPESALTLPAYEFEESPPQYGSINDLPAPNAFWAPPPYVANPRQRGGMG